MYNISLSNNIIPHTWKLTNIIPKPNKDMNIGTSYIPISLLSVIALEKTLLPYITNNIPHISTQHGFTSNHSTSTALHNINNTIATGFNHHSSTRHEQSIRHSQQTHTHSLINYTKQTSHTPLSNTSQTTSKAAKHTPHSETKYQHSAKVEGYLYSDLWF